MNDITRFNKLTAPENWGEYKIESLKKTGEEVLFICNFNTKVTALSAFFAGQRLAAMRAAMEHGKFLAWIKENFPYSQSTAYNYIVLFNFFKDKRANVARLENPDKGKLPNVGSLEDPDKNQNPVLELLEHPNLASALMAAGIIKRKAVQKEKGAEGYNRIDLGGDPDWARKELYEELFKLPADSGQPLKNHRTMLDPVYGIIMARRLANEQIIGKTVIGFYVDEPSASGDPVLRIAYNGMIYEIQAAVEKYLLSVEQYDNTHGEKQLWDARVSRKKWLEQQKREKKEKTRQERIEKAKRQNGKGRKYQR